MTTPFRVRGRKATRCSTKEIPVTERAAGKVELSLEETASIDSTFQETREKEDSAALEGERGEFFDREIAAEPVQTDMAGEDSMAGEENFPGADLVEDEVFHDAAQSCDDDANTRFEEVLDQVKAGDSSDEEDGVVDAPDELNEAEDNSVHKYASTDEGDAVCTAPGTSPSTDEKSLMRGYALIADLANLLMLPAAPSADPPTIQNRPIPQEETAEEEIVHAHEQDEQLTHQQDHQQIEEQVPRTPVEYKEEMREPQQTFEWSLQTIDEDAELEDNDEMWGEELMLQRGPHTGRIDPGDAATSGSPNAVEDDSTVPLSESFSEDSSSDQDEDADDNYGLHINGNVQSASSVRVRRRSNLKKQSAYEGHDATKEQEADSDAPPEAEPHVEIQDSLTMIAFDTIHVREYSITLGDHPGVSTGPPVTLGWDYEEMDPIDFDQYEAMKGEARTAREMRMTYYRRRELLLESGDYSSEDLDAASALVTKIKKQRKQSEKFIAVAPIEEALQTMKRAIRGRPREKCADKSHSTEDAIALRAKPKRRKSARRVMASAARAVVPTSQTNLAFWGRRDRRPWQMTLAGEMIARQSRSFVSATAGRVRRKTSNKERADNGEDSADPKKKSKMKNEKKPRSKVEKSERAFAGKTQSRKARQ